MLGAVSPESFDTLHSYSNTFQMPFVTPWFPEKVSKNALNYMWLHALDLWSSFIHHRYTSLDDQSKKKRMNEN